MDFAENHKAESAPIIPTLAGPETARALSSEKARACAAFELPAQGQLGACIRSRFPQELEEAVGQTAAGQSRLSVVI